MLSDEGVRERSSAARGPMFEVMVYLSFVVHYIVVCLLNEN